MDNAILCASIIDVEKEIQLSLDRAREGWPGHGFEAGKREAQEELRRGEERIREGRGSDRDQALQRAREEGAQRVQRAEQALSACRLSRHGSVSRCVERHLRRILPE